MIRPIDVAHVNLNVTDLERAVRFYTTVLGFTVTFQYECAVAWLHFGQYRDGVGGKGEAFHDLALYKVTQPAVADRRTRAGMNHLALRLASPEEVDRAADILARAGIKVLKGPATHKEDSDRYLYFEDPDGNMIELVASTLAGWPAQYLRA
jgi:catechol 2,3-dioxygenase-like lactoylglutathione lyase family enzyme